MKLKPILPDPILLHRAGIRQTAGAAILVHLARCGLQGSTCGNLMDATRMTYNGADSALERLRQNGWIVVYGRQNGRGRAKRYAISAKGWELLTRPVDFSSFPNATIALEESAR